MILNELTNTFLCCLYFFTVVLCQKCPTGWEEYMDSCYKFTRSPLKNYEAARSKCQAYNADLVSVNTIDEHNFISDWLIDNDPLHRRWYTSGRDDGDNFWVWDGDNSQFSNVEILWLPQDERNFGRNVAYNYSASVNKWGLVKVLPTDELAYICEILKENLHQIIIIERDIDYGVEVSDPEKLPRGPYFIKEPKSVIFDQTSRTQVNDISLKCVAAGYPVPSYRWFKEEYEQDNIINFYIDPLSDDRYTQTDGTLTIHRPDQIRDRGKYHCDATNKYGTVVSKTVSLSFGNIGEFNRKRSRDFGKENWGKSLSCDPPQHYPEVHYYWTRNQFPNFVEEDRRVFMSYDGNIYFSSLEKTDHANYSCNVQSVISDTGRTGPFFTLNVEAASSGQKLQFPNNFPKAFPEAPHVGKDIRLECVAYGYPVPSYNWTRRGNRLPSNAKLSNYNRVLIISKIKVEDMGEYVCTADNTIESIQKSISLTMQAFPEFTIPLGNKIMDHGTTLKWSCEAFGIPDVKYTWLKNGKEINVQSLSVEDVNRYRIFENILTINNVLPRDEGMFQCKASNQLGAAYSSGQLKVLTLAPTFQKYPLDVEMLAAEGGNVTIPCRPEAAPLPDFVWKHDGRVISGGRHNIHPNGYLHISNVRIDDEGSYTCLARNKYGSDKSTGRLVVLSEPRLLEYPQPKVVAIVNGSVELQCKAYTSSMLDVAYVWYHNDLKINYRKQQQFSTGAYSGYLFIHNISLAEAGVYKCKVKTSVGYTEYKTELIVIGPPGAPGAVLAEELTDDSGKVHWSDGSDNGRRITAYSIEGKTNHNSTWIVLAANVSHWEVRRNANRKQISLINVLSPWSTYNFRVLSINEFGQGPPSDPSPLYNTDIAAPHVSPLNVGGGGGKVGSLTITWDPLPPKDWNAPEIWYIIYYKSKDSKMEFHKKELKDTGSIHMYAVNVGEENYYKEYIVKVQAINSVGPGPISREVVIFSAERMPQVQPTRVQALPFNSTALNVSWSPLDLQREMIRGKLIGHRIKYWKKNEDSAADSLILLSRGARPWGLIVGLQPNTEYWVSVMAYNDAGSGVESERFLARTYKAAPLRSPTSVKLSVLTPTSVLVSWRGVLSTPDEEPITGYKVRYWEKDQDLASAKEVVRDLRYGEDLEAVVTNLVPGKAYKLRVLAYSLGGDGKMSSPPWEFLVGDGLAQSYKYSSTEVATTDFFSFLMLVLISVIL